LEQLGLRDIISQQLGGRDEKGEENKWRSLISKELFIKKSYRLGLKRFMLKINWRKANGI